jgi:hypothetical protein
VIPKGNAWHSGVRACQNESRSANCICLGVLIVLLDLAKSGFPRFTFGSESVGVLVRLNVSQRNCRPNRSVSVKFFINPISKLNNPSPLSIPRPALP